MTISGSEQTWMQSWYAQPCWIFKRSKGVWKVRLNWIQRTTTNPNNRVSRLKSPWQIWKIMYRKLCFRKPCTYTSHHDTKIPKRNQKSRKEEIDYYTNNILRWVFDQSDIYWPCSKQIVCIFVKRIRDGSMVDFRDEIFCQMTISILFLTVWSLYLLAVIRL